MREREKALLRRYCRCGDHMECEIAPPSSVDKVNAAWDQVHTGEGHGEVSREQCLRAYQGQETRQ